MLTTECLKILDLTFTLLRVSRIVVTCYHRYQTYIFNLAINQLNGVFKKRAFLLNVISDSGTGMR